MISQYLQTTTLAVGVLRQQARKETALNEISEAQYEYAITELQDFYEYFL